MTVNRPQEKGTRGGILLGYGLRPFFLFGGLYATLAIVAWLVMLVVPAGAEGATGPYRPALWHGHEMVFGYTAAVIAGFLLTAVPTWTETPILPRPRLALLVALWGGGRLVMWGAALLPPVLVAAVDLLFLPALAAMVAPPIWRRGARRNLVFVALLAVLTAANAAVHAEAIGVGPGIGTPGLVVAVDAVAVLLVIVGGRIVPAFTTNALRQRLGGDPGVRSFPLVNRLSIAFAVGVLVLDAVAAPSAFVGWAALGGGVLLAVRMAGWRTVACLGQPILWVLHLGYAWVVVGYLVKGLAALGAPVDPVTALHALTAGGIGTMTLGVMTRAALGHTGRPLVVAPAIAIAYVMVSVGAVLRVLGPVVTPELYEAANLVAGLLWAGAFAVFGVVYWPILTRPRVDGRPG